MGRSRAARNGAEVSDPINSDGTVADSLPEALERLTFVEASPAGAPPDLVAPLSPLDPAYAVRVEPSRVVNTRSWAKRGGWKYRQFGNEIQMRCIELPGVQLDLFRNEAELLHDLLGEMLSRPVPLPARVPWWTRLRMWWLRKVWQRKHYAELDAWRGEVLSDFTRRGPWG